MPPRSTCTPRRSRPRATTRAGSAFTRCWRPAGGRSSRGSSDPGTPAPTTPTATASSASSPTSPIPNMAALEVLHRQHAQVEDRVKTLKATGASYLPFHDFAANAAWFELALTAHDVMVFTQLLTLDGEHQAC